jgi:hypothetical protein
MSSPDTSPDKLTLGQFAEKFRNEMVPLGVKFAYFSAAVHLTDDDIREYLEDPIAALPPALSRSLPDVMVLLVPYVERGNGSEKGNGQGPAAYVAIDEPPETRSASYAVYRIRSGSAVLAFAVKDQEIADYHYRFYHALAELAADTWGLDVQEQFYRVIREELSSGVHGEVDEESWHSKQALLRRQTNMRRSTKIFRDYARQSFIDTLTLYLHGICCDIDVETGPRQLPSRYLRKRLTALHSLYPPPEGYAVFPEDLNQSK